MVGEKNKVGRPLAFETVEELKKKIDEYFDWCDNRSRTIYDNKTGQEVVISFPAPYTMSGLARRLGVDRRTITNYSKDEDFFPTIREARERIHEDVETRMMETKNERGAMFSLKNNFDWEDKKIVENPKDAEGVMDKLKEIDGKLNKQMVEKPESSEQSG